MAGGQEGQSTPPFGPAEFAAALDVSRETIDRLAIFVALLEKWNPAINLIAPRDLPDIWRRHILDSAQLLQLLPEAPPGRKRRIIDLGSGAGFPGLILAILGAGEVHLIESDGRKCAFLTEAVRLTCAIATVHNLRIESLPQKLPNLRADVIVARGLAPLEKLIDFSMPLIEKNGICLFLKGRNVASELTLAEKNWHMRVEQLPSSTSEAGVILRIGEIN